MNTSFFEIAPGRALELSIGVSFVVVSAYSRFNRPVDKDLARLAPAYRRAGVRASTTLYRFFGAVLGYVCVNLTLYYLLVADERWRDALLRVGNVEDLEAWRFSVPLFSALLLTVLAPKLPPLSTVDHTLRRMLQRTAAIPQRVQHEIARLKRSPHTAGELDAIAIEGVKSKIDGDTYAALLLTASMLRRTKEWPLSAGFAVYAATFDDVRGLIQDRFDETLEALGDRPAPEVVDARPRRRSDATVFMLRDHVLEYVARGILITCPTSRRRSDAIRALGFQVDESEPRLHAISLLFVVIWGALVAGYLLLRPLFGEIKGGYVLYKCATIASYLCASVWVALMRRDEFPIERRSFRQRPFGKYLLSGMGAVLVCLFLSVAFKLPRYGDYSLVFQDLGYSYPWQALAFTIGFGTALAFDTVPRREAYSAGERAWFGGGIGASSAIIGYMVVILMKDMRAGVQAAGGEPSPAILGLLDPLPSPWAVAAICLVFGALVGGLVPRRVHSNRLLNARDREDLGSTAFGAATAVH